MAAGERVSPLIRIQEKERELARRLAEARQRADDLVARAREQATAIKDAAEREGLQEAEAFVEREVAKTREQAEEIKAAARKEAEKLHRRGEENVARAAQVILDFVLPRG
ncbi:MAG: V-type ATPase subunit subunit G family protein [Anaerolineae bacterium]